MATPLEVAARAIDGFREELKAKDLRLNNLSEAATSFRRQRDAAIERHRTDAGRAWEMYLIAMMVNDIVYGRQLAAEVLVKRGKHLLALVLAGASLPGVGLQAGIEDFLGYTRAPAEARRRQAR